MKLSKEQIQEIKDQQTQKNATKRVTRAFKIGECCMRSS